MKPLLIYGAGGLGREVLSWARFLSEWTPTAFVDDNVKAGTLISGIPVLGGIEQLQGLSKETGIVIAVGDPQGKESLARKLNGRGLHQPVLIHPSTILQDRDSIKIGDGSIISAGCILTTEIVIGKYALVNLNVTIGHNTRIGDFSSIMPGVNIAGNVTIAHGVLVGSGANIINNVTIGDYCKVGAGAVVTKDVNGRTTVVGIPAKPVSK